MFTGLILAAALAAAPPALPPTPRFRSYGVAQGLPSSRTYVSVQDRAGYLWIGTGDGLVRFDGRNFQLFRHQPGRPDSLPANDVSALLIDRDGVLWAGGEGNGLNRYDAASGGFRHWLHGEDAASLANNDLMALAQTADGAIWVGMYAAGVDRLHDDGRGFDHLRHRDGDDGSLASDNVFALLGDSAGRLWIGTDHGLDVRGANGRVDHVRFDGEDKPPYVWQIAGDGDDIRVATSAGLFMIGRDGVARRWPADSPHGTVYSSLRMADGTLWVGARGELRLYAPDGSVKAFKTQPLLVGGLSGQTLVGLNLDREGGLWIDSLDAGLAYLGPDWRTFSSFGHVPEDAGSLAGNRIRALAVEPDGRLLVGGLRGQLDRFDPASGAVEHLEVPAHTGDASVLSLAADTAGRLWIGTEHDLRQFDHGVLRTVMDERLRAGVHVMLVDADGTLLASPLGNGMLRIDPKTLAETPLASAQAGAADAETRQLTRIDGAIWRATSAGLSRLEKGSNRFVFVPGVKPGVVHAFAERGGDLWLARIGALEEYRLHDDGSASLLRSIDNRAGWPGVDINCLFVDARGRVWLTSRTGLWRFDPVDGGFRRYSIEDGLPSPEFSQALVALDDGTVYAGTLDGVVGFRPAEETDHPRPPLLTLGDATVRRDGRHVGLPLHDSAVHLGWDDHELTVTARALSFIDPARNHYRFRMDGFDSGWVDTGAQGAREFTGLGPGDYRLEIEAAGPSGAWAALPQAIAVHVAAPPWQRPWAWALYALVALFLAWLAWHVTRQRVERRVELGLLQQQRQLAERASAAKTRFLATLGHEIRTPMTGVLGMAELLTHTTLDTRQRGMVDTIRRSGSVLLKLVNDALDLARIEAGRLDLESAPLDPVALLHEVVALDSGLAETKGIDIEVTAAADVPRSVLGDAVRIRQILLNLVGNALKFTERGSVRVSLDMDEGALRYSVADSGPGLTEAVRQRLFRRFEQGDSGSHSGGSGLGLAICRELATLMGGRVDVESQPGQGSTFRVWLPLPRGGDAAGIGESAGGRALPHRRIVLVEDDATVAAVIVGLLEAQGHEVRHVAHALAALAEIEVAACDAVLVDLDLPDLDGFELIRMLRAQPGGGDLFIVVVTARADRGDEDKARAVGADAFLRKPVSGDELAAVLADA